MKKIFTLFTAALFAASLWGTNYEIGTSGTTSSNETVPIHIGASNAYTITQQLYLASELTALGASSDDITEISFYYNTTGYTYTRSIEVWIMETTSSNVATSTGSGKWFKSVSSTDKSAGTKVFDGNVVLPATADWYTIKLDTKFAWHSTKNIIITVYDKTGTKASSIARKHKVFTPSSAARSLTANSSSAYNAGNTFDISGTASTIVPVIRINIGSSAATPTITLDKSSVNLGTFDAAYETVSQSFFVKGSDLTADVTISAAVGLSVDPSSITKEAIAAAGTTGVEVTVSNTSSFAFNSPKVTVSSTGADSKQVTISGTAASYTDKISIPALKEAELNGYYKLTASATINSIEGQTMVISSNGTLTVDFSAIGSSYQVFGKVTNVKGKLISADLFKAFSMDYTEPAGVTIDQDQDNSVILAENDGETVNVHLARSFTAGMYNTICLPFGLNSANLELTFGNNYSLIELSGTSKDGDDIVLTFDEVTELESGKPYFIKPTQAVNNPSFSNKEISKDLAPIETTYADFIPVFSPTALASSKDILFLGANNELFWPSNAGTLKGLRCYFQMKNGASAGAPVRMSIGRGTPTSNETLEDNAPAAIKRIENGQLIIERNGVRYNINGQIIK